ncbi:MAG: hypothetical protein JWO52_1975 [Gammaproteobacteria bacterium]|jgi:hypothetical protein|nr:hypothetical protein [Gammaproteobacteria bacterium]
MNRLILSLVLLMTTGPALADLQAPARSVQPVADPTMVIIDRGATLEVLPTSRAMPHADASGRVVSHHVRASSATALIGPRQLGVVFNHSMQQQGFITGEIAFKLRAGHTTAELSPALYPGLKQIASPAVYVTNARTPAEFINIFKLLQGRPEVEWVEPIVSYSPADSASTNK